MSKQGEFQKNFAFNLRWQLKKNDKKQQDIIRDLKFPSGSVSAWCSGTRIPRMDKVQMLADYFHIQPSELLKDRTEDMVDELFEKKQLLFDKSSKASAEDLDKILAIVDMIVGDNE